MVFEDDVEELKTTADVLKALQSIGLEGDVDPSQGWQRTSALGKGKMRGRRFKAPRSLLIVVSDPRSAHVQRRQEPGRSGDRLRGQAQPGQPGPGRRRPDRLTVFSESAIKKVGEW